MDKFMEDLRPAMLDDGSSYIDPVKDPEPCSLTENHVYLVIHSHPIRYKHPSETKVAPKKNVFLLSLNNGFIWFLCLKSRWDDHGSILFQQLEMVYGVSTSIVSTRRRKGTHCARTHHWSGLAGRQSNPRKSDGNLRGSVATVQWKLIATDDSLLHCHHCPIEIWGGSIASSDYLAALRNSLPSPSTPNPFPGPPLESVRSWRFFSGFPCESLQCCHVT